MIDVLCGFARAVKPCEEGELFFSSGEKRKTGKVSDKIGFGPIFPLLSSPYLVHFPIP